MPVGFRPHRRRTKPNNIRLHYDPGYWGRLGMPQPTYFAPIFGPGANGKLPDYSPTGANGTITSAPFVGTALGLALKFSGTGVVNCGSALAYAGVMSAAAWINPGLASGQQQWFGTYTAQVIDGFAIEFGRTANKISVNWNGAVILTSTASLSTGNWYHVTIVRTGSTGAWNLSIYINGVLDSTTASAQNPATGGTLCLGARANGSGPFTGYISQAAAWNGYGLTAAQVAARYAQSWAMFGSRDVGFGTSAGPASTTGAGMLSARATLLASSIFGGVARVSAAQSHIASSIYGAEGTIVSTKTVLASSVKAAAAGIHASQNLIASSLRAASASIQASAAKSVTHNLTSGEASAQARSAEIASSILAAVAQIRALSSQTNNHAVAALAQFAATGNAHCLTNLLHIQEQLSAAAALINHTTRTAAGAIGSEAISAVTLNLLSLAEHVEALAEELASEIEHPGAGGGARATVVASNPAHASGGIGAAAQVFSTSGQVAVTAWAIVTPKVQAVVNVSPKALAEVDAGY